MPPDIITKLIVKNQIITSGYLTIKAGIFPCLYSICRVFLLTFDVKYLVNHAVLFGLFGNHPIIAVGISFKFFNCLA